MADPIFVADAAKELGMTPAGVLLTITASGHFYQRMAISIGLKPCPYYANVYPELRQRKSQFQGYPMSSKPVGARPGASWATEF